MLDGVAAVATTIYIVLTAVVAMAVLAALGYLILNPPESFVRVNGSSVGLVFLLVSGFDQSLYQRALQLAVDATPDTSQ